MSRDDFFLACSQGLLTDVKKLLEDPTIDINKQQKDGTTPLYIACQNRHIEVIDFLLKNPNIDVNLSRTGGETPLYIACDKGFDNVVRLLLKKENINLNKATKYGATPLYIACQKGFFSAVKLLLANTHIDVNQSVEDGATPLYAACTNNRNNVVKILLEDQRVNINIATQKKLTPFRATCLLGGKDTIKLFLKKTMNTLPLAKIKLNNTKEILKEIDATIADFTWGKIKRLAQDDKLTFKPEGSNKSFSLSDLIKEGIREFITEYFVYVILICDGYASLKQQKGITSEKEKNALKFFKLAVKLPMDVQQTLCCHMFGSGRSIISATATDGMLKNLTHSFLKQRK